MPQIRNSALRAVSEREAKPRALLVDDDVLIGYAAMADLADEGFDVVLRLNGKEGLDLARVEPFDLIITDLMMPGMDGLAMIAALRALGATMPIILATAVQGTSLPALDRAGFDAMLPKPYRASEIRRVARQLVAALPLATRNGTAAEL